MSFQDAVMTCLQKKYADFSGRARRSEFWYFYLLYFIVYIIALFAGAKLPTIIGLVLWVVLLGLVVPTIAAGIRRMHDTGRSGWWVLLPIGNLVFWAGDSQPGDNQYGPSPKAIAGYGQA